ncbi:MAG: ATP-binding protein [Pseudomonadota bacterium]
MVSPEVAVKRLEREQKARREAERLLEEKSLELFSSNQSLVKLADTLTKKSSKLEAIINHTLAGIFHIDGGGVILEANAAAREIFAYEGEELMGVNIFDLVSEEGRAHWQTITSCENEPASHTSDGVTGVRKTGDHFPLEVAVAMLQENAQRDTVWICRDITERHEADKQKAIMQNELGQAQKLESLGTLASGIAHEINTPVQYVTDNVKFLAEAVGDLETILEKYAALVKAVEESPTHKDLCMSIRACEDEIDLEFLMEEAPSASEHALEGLAQIAKIVAAIKSFAHPGVEEKALIDLNDAIETTSTVCRNQWKYVANLETDFDKDLPMVPCLPGELNQVILNLIVNAAHAIEDKQDASSNKIRIQTKQIDGFAEVRISDTGCGISEANAKKIFDPFFTTKEVGRGTGQGLSLCYSIVTQKHGGRLSFESEVGKGTTFIIQLPFDQGATATEAA